VQVLRHPPTETIFHSGVVQPWYMLINMMALAGLTYGHIWITGARQRMLLQSQAHTDALTGVLNRRALEVAAEREISRSRRGKQPLAVMMCDLDDFKQANDALGHNYGDKLLRAAAEALRATLRREDLIARLGGDEFVIILPDTNREMALEVAERLRREVERLHVVEQGRHMELFASFGVALLDSDTDDTWKSLLERADAALYAAKHIGGNHIVMDPVPQRRAAEPFTGTA
jgi:diguanylate cyclase (GGDEF)-like protein